jgi:signal transduction histidine kinase
VLLNLVTNAAHAVAEVVAKTGRRGRIDVRSWREARDVIVSVRDTGFGIPTEIHEKLFEPFFTTKDVGRGTGQGLAIARSLVVDMHGGEITFDSDAGLGTEFRVRIPIEGRPCAAELS